MIKYDPSNRILRFKKYDSDSVGHDLLQDQKNAHINYRSKKIYADARYLGERLTDELGFEVRVTAEVGELVSIRPSIELTGNGSAYYPVTFNFHVDNADGTVTTRTVRDILRIPDMDQFCTLNVDGNRKVLISEITSNEDVSFDIDKGEVIVTLPLRSITFKLSKSGKVGLAIRSNNFIEADLACIMMAEKDGVLYDKSVFANSIMVRSSTDRTFQIEEAFEAEKAKNSFIEYLKSEKCTLERTRKALNVKLTIDSALGREISRPIYLSRDNRDGAPFEECRVVPGTVVDSALLAKLKWNFINEVYVKARPRVEGLYLAEDLHITKLEAKTKVNRQLCYYAKDLKRNSILPRETEVNFVIPADTNIDEDLSWIIYRSNINEFKCYKKKVEAKIPRVYTCEQEIIGNKTCRMGDVLKPQDIPENVSADDYTYYHNQDYLGDTKGLKVINPDRLNNHDLVALFSLTAREISDPNFNILRHRDRDFLKKIELADSIFSKTLREAMMTFLKEFKQPIVSYLKAGHTTQYSDSPFFGLHKKWISTLNKSTLLSEAEDTNPVALLSQARRVKTRTQSAESAPTGLRMIGMGYYGRICPYETPAGSKIGLTNNLALGCKIVDGIPYTYYRKVVQTRQGYRLAESTVMMTAEQESQYKIGDILTLSFDKDGYIENTKVLAKLPNPTRTGSDPMVMLGIDSHYLDYVYAYPEQHLSAATGFIPFANSNDGARVSFGINLLKQGIYIQNSEVPRVLTPLYSKVFDYSDTYLKRADKDGYVVSIQHNAMIVQYDGDTDTTSIEMSEVAISNHVALFRNYKKTEGEEFSAGDILVDTAMSRDGYYSPGANLITVYISDEGWNYEDGQVLSEHGSHIYTSIGGHEQTKAITVRRGERNFTARIAYSNRYKFLEKNDTISTITTTQLDKSAKSSERFRSDRSGILYDIDTVEEDNKKIYIAKILTFNRLGGGDKMAGRHGNKGVDSLVRPNSEMPMFLNGEHADAAFNSTGVVSRMNVGQLLEGYLGFVGLVLDIRIESEAFNGARIGEIRTMMKWLWSCCNESVEVAMKKYPGVPVELNMRAKQRQDVLNHWKGCFNEDGSAPLYDPITGTMYEYPITFGVQYVLKMEQEAEEKVHARSGELEEPYVAKTQQPTKGAQKHGGQRVGEMELAAIAGHGASAYLHEITNERSDNVERRTNSTCESLGLDPVFEDTEDTIPRGTEVFAYELEVANVKLTGDGIPSLDTEDIIDRRHYDPAMLVRRKASGEKSVKTTKTIYNDLLSI